MHRSLHGVPRARYLLPTGAPVGPLPLRFPMSPWSCCLESEWPSPTSSMSASYASALALCCSLERNVSIAAYITAKHAHERNVDVGEGRLRTGLGAHWQLRLATHSAW